MANFTSLFQGATDLEVIKSLLLLNFDKFLFSLINLNSQPFVFQRCLGCVSIWLNKFPLTCDLFYSPDFVMMIYNLGFNGSQVRLDHRSCFYFLMILETLIKVSLDCASILISHDIINNITDFYLTNNEKNLRRGALNVLYFIFKTKHSELEIISDFKIIFSDIGEDQISSNLDAVCLVASSIIEFNEQNIFFLYECFPFEKCFELFKNFSNGEQRNFIQILINIYKSSCEECIQTITDCINLDSMILTLCSSENNNFSKEKFAQLLCLAFQKNQQIIVRAAKGNVFQILFQWVTFEPYNIKYFSYLALIRAMRFNMPNVGIKLLDFGVLAKVSGFLENSEKDIFLDTCLMTIELQNYAVLIRNKALYETISQIRILDLYKEILNDDKNNFVPCDSLELFKDMLSEVHNGKLWLYI